MRFNRPFTTEQWARLRQQADVARADERVQAEVRVAAEILQQHPDVTRDEALRVAARIVARDL